MQERRSLLMAAGCAAVLVSSIAHASALSQADPLAGFDAYVAKAVQDWRTPGLAVAVVRNGQVVFSKGYGVRELGGGQPVDTHTLFAIGSTTKAMTAALIGMLVDEKKLKWDDPVVTHLPWFQLKDPYLTREITIRDLLTHRAGLGNADYLWYGQTTPARDILERVRLLEPSYSLRSSFIYQNVMYAAAGAVVEAVSGRSWEQMMRLRIFEPLGMQDSIATAAPLASLSNVAKPHHIVAGTLRVITNASVDGVAPAGSVWSSVHDMSKWMQMLLDGGKAGPRTLLEPETVSELFKPQSIVTREGFYPTARLTKPHWTTYGLGWFQQDYRGRAVDFHTGSIDGMVAIHGLIRNERLGVYVLANRDHTEVRHALMLNVFDRFIGVNDRDWSAELQKLYADLDAQAHEARKKRNAGRVSQTSPTLPLANYAGTYSDPLRGDVTITLEGDRLRARYGTAFVGPLEHWNYDTFRAAWEAEWRGDALLTFGLDANGKPVRLEAFDARFLRKPDAPQPAGAADAAAALDALFGDYASGDTPGCAIGVVQRGQVVAAKAYGFADLEHRVPLTTGSPFYMASVSKQFMALAVLLLEREGKLRLDDGVRKYVPELPSYADDITLRHLLHHTSGIRDYLTLGSLAGYQPDHVWTERGAVRMIARQQQLNFPVGTEHLYSNSGYVLLSIVAQRVTGRTLDQWAREHVFLPLGMSSTRFQHNHSHVIPNRAAGYVRQDTAWRLGNSMLDVVGDGGLYSTLDDMVRWATNFDDGRIAPEQLSRLQIVGTLADDSAIKAGYGMGLARGEYRGLETISHGGALVGYRTMFLRFPAEKTTVICLCNASTANAARLAQRVAELYLRDAMTPAAPAAGPPTASEPRPGGPVPAELRKALAGSFHSSELDAIYVIREDGERLLAELGERPPVTVVLAESNRLRLEPSGVVIVPHRDANGRVTGFMLDAGRVRGLRFMRR